MCFLACNIFMAVFLRVFLSMRIQIDHTIRNKFGKAAEKKGANQKLDIVQFNLLFGLTLSMLYEKLSCIFSTISTMWSFLNTS